MKKIKAAAARFDAPKRVEIKELEISLLKMVEFSELNDEKKMKVCREIAFIIKDLALMYNMCNEGSPQIQMEFLGYKTENDEKKIWAAKDSTFNYF